MSTENLRIYSEAEIVQPVVPEELIGCRILRSYLNGGNYGMGSCGYPSWAIDKPGLQWLRLPIWAGGAWLHVNGQIVENSNPLSEERAICGTHHNQEYEKLFDEQPVIRVFQLAKHSFRLVAGLLTLELKADPASRPQHYHFGEKRLTGLRALSPDEDLRTGMVMTSEEWEGETTYEPVDLMMRRFEKRDPVGYAAYRAEGAKAAAAFRKRKAS